jgi:hypothetical protein
MASRSTSRRPRALEQTISLCIVAALGGVLAGMLLQQTRFNPAVNVALAVAAKPAAAPGPAVRIPDLLASWPAGLRPMSAAETFAPATLSDKIDGKAELYLSAGFVALTCQRVALSGAADAWMEMYVFDMGNPANAYSVYSSQRRPEAVDATVGDYGYLAGNQLCLVHGKYYLEVIAAEAKDSTMQAADTLARGFVRATAVTEHANVADEQSLFPGDGMIEGTLSLFSSDVFGFDRLQHVFVARYREGPDEVPLFLTRRATPAEAAELAKAFHRFLVHDCGGTELSPPADLPGAVIVDLGGAFDGVFVAGSIMGGIHQAPNREAAERWMRRLHQSVHQGKP